MLHKLGYGVMLALVLVIVITGCSKGEVVNDDELPEILSASFIMPERVEPGQEATYQVKVSQGDKPVDDAGKVQFQIWEDVDGAGEGSVVSNMNEADENDMIKAEPKGDGIYQITSTIKTPGKYYIQVHVTARDMHVMPRQSFYVGQEPEEHNGTDQENDTNDANSGEGHHH